MTPDHMAYLQSKAPGAPQAAAPQAPTPHPMLASSVNIGQHTLTRLDRP
jgi:hypothetical protein